MDEASTPGNTYTYTTPDVGEMPGGAEYESEHPVYFQQKHRSDKGTIDRIMKKVIHAMKTATTNETGNPFLDIPFSLETIQKVFCDPDIRNLDPESLIVKTFVSHIVAWCEFGMRSMIGIDEPDTGELCIRYAHILTALGETDQPKTNTEKFQCLLAAFEDLDEDDL